MDDAGVKEQRSSPDRPKYQLWPSIKKSVVFSGRRTPDLGVYRVWNSSQSSVASGDSRPATASSSQRQFDKMPGRKNHGADASLALMTTVQEYYMDSPTIPGRFPIMHERSQSAPSESSARNPFESVFRQPISRPLVIRPMESTSRTASPIGTSSSQVPDGVKQGAETGLGICGTQPEDDRPPAVPPKSPRVMKKAVRTGPLPTSRFNPAPICTSDPTSSTQAETTKCTAQRPRSPPEPILSQQKDEKPARAATPPDGKQSPTFLLDDDAPAASWTHKRSESASAVGDMKKGVRFRDELERGPGLIEPRERAGTPIMERGRPAKRNKIVLGSQVNKNNADRESPGGLSSVAQPPGFEKLPSGPTPANARAVLSAAEIDTLLAQAKGQACMFQVLREKDVKTHARELKVLDERCDYLRNTYNYLRSGRRNLHERMMAFLRSSSSMTVVVCKDTILKQEEALAELDLSIDEWVTKLEYAENRRIRVRQKLLEHFAAVMMLQTMSTTADESQGQSQGQGQSQSCLHLRRREETTPPPSPSRRKDFAGASSPDNHTFDSITSTTTGTGTAALAAAAAATADDCFDSIKIRVYADSGVHADAQAQCLIAEIEREMEAIKSRSSILSTPSDSLR